MRLNDSKLAHKREQRRLSYHRRKNDLDNIAKRKEYRQINREQHNLKCKEWYQKHREEQLVKMKDRYHAHDKPSIQSSWENFLSQRLKDAIQRAKRKQITLDIDLKYLMDLIVAQNYKCAITGKSMTHILKDPYMVSIDRIDSTRGYSVGNIQLLCHIVNLAKKNFTDEQIRRFFQ